MISSRVARAIRAQDYRSSLFAFGKRAFRIVQNCEYVHGRHVDVMVPHLEALAKKEIKRLLMNLPPSCTKSTWMMVLFPAWIWTWWPECKVQGFAYNEKLAIRDQLLTRHLIGSDWYRQLFPEVQVKFGEDQKQYFALTSGGERRIGTPGSGLGTGGHSDVYLFDDLLSRDLAESPRERQKVVDWYFETMSTRGIARDQVHGLGMQRLHVEDLPGEILRKHRENLKAGKPSPWYHVMLPMRFDPGRKMQDRGYGGDWRTKEGELLFPELLDEETVMNVERDLGPHGSRCQLGQDPKRRDGNLFKVTRITMIDMEDVPVDSFLQMFRFWDLAGTDERDNKDAAWTAGVLMARANEAYYVLNVRRKRIGGDEVEDLIAATAAVDEKMYGRSVVQIRFEREPGSSGKRVAEQLCKRLRKYPVKDIRPEKSKEVRADPFAAAVSRYEVFVVVDEWTVDYIDELTQFPGGKFKDQVDASSGAFLEFDAPGAKGRRIAVAASAGDGMPDEYGEIGRCGNPTCKRPAFGGDYCCECCEKAHDNEVRQGDFEHESQCNGMFSDWFARAG